MRDLLTSTVNGLARTHEWARRILARLRSSAPTREDYEKQVEDAFHLAQMKQTPGWQIFEAAVRDETLKNKTLLAYMPAEELQSKKGLDCAKYIVACEKIMEQADHIILRGAAAERRLNELDATAETKSKQPGGMRPA